MRKKGTYKLLIDKPLIVEYYSGDITANDLIAQKVKMKLEPDYDFQCNTIIDFRDSELKIDEEGLNLVFEYFKNSLSSNKSRKIGYLTSKPNEVVLAMLFLKMNTEAGLNYTPNIFSTEAAAVDFFGQKIITEQEFSKIIYELKKFGENTFI